LSIANNKDIINDNNDNNNNNDNNDNNDTKLFLIWSILFLCLHKHKNDEEMRKKIQKNNKKTV
jgi:hypothetical protein